MNTLTKPHAERDATGTTGTTGTQEPTTTPATPKAPAKDRAQDPAQDLAQAPAEDPTTDAAQDRAAQQTTAAQPSRSRADGMAVASFIFGLLGTLVGNIVLGPCALIFGGLALAHHTNRRGRAILGMTLGAIDLAILLTLVTTDGTISWHIGG
ncbi:hypothetical protein [Streptomyces sp. NPDC048248]|uniref:hypothetical protein n=1 Tax=Streptomyces sp. NPDC048248 TaxID=3365523 RepID=UPI003724B661